MTFRLNALSILLISIVSRSAGFGFKGGFVKHLYESIPDPSKHGIRPATFSPTSSGTSSSAPIPREVATEPVDYPDSSALLSLTEQENAMIRLFDRVRPSVVFVSTIMQAFNPLQMNVMEVPSQSGSGFVWDVFGHIVTNYHVVGQNANDVLVTFVREDGSREEWRAKVRGVDADKDIAVLKLIDDYEIKHTKKSLVKPVRLGTSKRLRVGQLAIAIGNPFGLDQTLTTGVISGLGRQVAATKSRTLVNMIQTDAAINPGNSGGPLLDSSGLVVGMNTAIYSTSGASAGIGFAIPVDTLKAVVEIIIRDGKVNRPNTGIQFYSGPDQAKVLGVERGLVVLSVVPGSAADHAGLRGVTRRDFTFSSFALGDIIVAVNGMRVDSEADFLRAIDEKVVGDTIEMRVLRYIGEVKPASVDYFATEPKKRSAVETTLRLRLAAAKN